MLVPSCLSHVDMIMLCTKCDDAIYRIYMIHTWMFQQWYPYSNTYNVISLSDTLVHIGLQYRVANACLSLRVSMSSEIHHSSWRLVRI